MTFTSEFELFDEVYALHDSSIVKFSVRKIEFPIITKWNQDSKYILYGLLPSRELYIYDTMAESENYYITRSEDQLGKTVNELFEKLNKQNRYEDRKTNS